MSTFDIPSPTLNPTETRLDSSVNYDPLPAYSTWVIPDQPLTPSAKTPTSEQNLTKPLTPYNLFLENLKDPSCKDVVMAVKRLSVELPKASRAETAKIVHEFLNSKFLELIKTSAFCSPWDHQDVSEGLEKFTFQKLYSTIFQMDKNDIAQDRFIHRRLTVLSWITLEHLDIPTNLNYKALENAITHLRKIDKFKAPLDKITIIINTCKILTQAIQESKLVNSDKPAADQLLPLMIYTLIHANPPRLASNIAFIQHFRHPKKLVAQEAYALTQICAAIEYTKILNHTQVQGISELEFESLCNKMSSRCSDELTDCLNALEDAASVISGEPSLSNVHSDFGITNVWRGGLKNSLAFFTKKSSILGMFNSPSALSKKEDSHSGILEGLTLMREVLNNVDVDDFSTSDAENGCLDIEKIIQQHSALCHMRNECLNISEGLIDSILKL